MNESTKMSLFSPTSILNQNSQVIVISKDSNDKWINQRIALSDAAACMGQSRWLTTPPSSYVDSIGSNGSEAFKQIDAKNAEYYVKINNIWFKMNLTTF